MEREPGKHAGGGSGEEQKGPQGRAGGAREEAGQAEKGRRGPPSYASGKNIGSLQARIPIS